MKDAELQQLISDEVKAQVKDVLDNKVTLDFETFAKRDMQQGIYEKLKEGYKYVGISHRPCTVAVNAKYKSIRYFNLSNEHDVQLFYKTLGQEADGILSVTAVDTGPFTGGARTGRHVDSMCAPTLKDGTYFPGTQREKGRVRMASKATSDEWRIKLDGKVMSASAASHAMTHMVRNGYEWDGVGWSKAPFDPEHNRIEHHERLETAIRDVIREHTGNDALQVSFVKSCAKRIMNRVYRYLPVEK